MGRLIKNVRGRNLIEYDAGAFDNWCVYLKKGDSTRYAPRDAEYFNKLVLLGDIHGHQKIYDDFVIIYKQTNNLIDKVLLEIITNLSQEYGSDSEEIDILFTIIYAGMVAEENKEFTKLGKRIKRLGMHQILTEKLDANIAADFSKGKKWRELDALMLQRGF